MRDEIKTRLALIWIALTKRYFFITATSNFEIGKKKYCYEILPEGAKNRIERDVFLEATSEFALKLKK